MRSGEFTHWMITSIAAGLLIGSVISFAVILFGIIMPQLDALTKACGG